jgi:hypothetical protein
MFEVNDSFAKPFLAQSLIGETTTLLRRHEVHDERVSSERVIPRYGCRDEKVVLSYIS